MESPCSSPLNIIEVRTIGTILLHAPLADEVARECDGVGVLSSDWYTVQLANIKLKVLACALCIMQDTGNASLLC